MATLGKLIVDLVANTSSLKTGLDGARQDINKFSNDAANGANKAQNAITNLGLDVLGLKGKVGKLAEGMLLLGVGGGVTLALTAGLAIAGHAYKKLTEEKRKAREELEKFIEARRKARQEQGDPFKQDRQAIEHLTKEAAKLQGEIAATEAKFRTLGHSFLAAPSLQKKLEDLRKDLHETQQKLAGHEQDIAKPGGELIQSLGRQLAALQTSEAAVKRLEIANTAGLTPAQRAAALAIYDQIVALKAQEEAQKKAADALKEHLKFLERLHEAHNRAGAGIRGMATEWRDAAIKQVEAQRKIEEEAAQGTKERLDAKWQEVLKDVNEHHPALKAAREWKEAWRDAIDDSMQAFANFFQQAFTEGAKLRDFLKGLLASIANVFASFAARQAATAIAGAVGVKADVKHAGGLVGSGGPTRDVPAWLFAGARRMHNGGFIGADEVPIIAQRGERVLSRAEAARGGGPRQTIIQNITFNAGFVDGATGEAWLQSRAGTIVGMVGRAAKEVPGYARGIVAHGSRR